ncbi:MAG: protein phosphatase 2C domain-containing protein [Saccharofermentans sp.]|nr:protein phosphatase 2C domain-containing protein [Saccharofermentans sp.]
MKTVPVDFFEDSKLMSAFLSVLGDRENQEDSFAIKSTDTKHNSLFVVCDGMGGSNGGELASKAAVDFFVQKYDGDEFETDIVNALENATHEADLIVNNLSDSNGNSLQAGTTLVAVILDGYEMYWSSVGDSRLYLLREKELVQITVDHNYKEYLKEKYKLGDIEQSVYMEEINGPKAEALLSFLGLNGLQLINRNINPFRLQKDDVVMLISDGLYKVLDDAEMLTVLSNFRNVKDAVIALENKATKKSKKQKLNRDNTTIGLIKIK